MKISRLSGLPSPALARELVNFEQQFVYPLGPGRFFRIVHSEDATLFFQAIGDDACFIAEKDGCLLGALGTAVRPLWLPSGEEHSVAYLGGLKITPQARGGIVLRQLARTAEAALRPLVQSAFAVVMEGTSLTLEAYTGRAGIPLWEKVGQVSILRLSPRGSLSTVIPTSQASPHVALECYRRLSFGRYATPVGCAAKRSYISPCWLMHPESRASGFLEDTRRAKRLINQEGTELLSAHLSCFAFADPAAGAELIQSALLQALSLGLPALFVALAPPDLSLLQPFLTDLEILHAPASIFGVGLNPGSWNINTSEI